MKFFAVKVESYEIGFEYWYTLYTSELLNSLLAKSPCEGVEKCENKPSKRRQCCLEDVEFQIPYFKRNVAWSFFTSTSSV